MIAKSAKFFVAVEGPEMSIIEEGEGESFAAGLEIFFLDSVNLLHSLIKPL